MHYWLLKKKTILLVTQSLVTSHCPTLSAIYIKRNKINKVEIPSDARHGRPPIQYRPGPPHRHIAENTPNSEHFSINKKGGFSSEPLPLHSVVKEMSTHFSSIRLVGVGYGVLYWCCILGWFCSLPGTSPQFSPDQRVSASQ